MGSPVSIEFIQELLINIRGQKLLLDSDVARIYGIETKRVNEAVRNNPDKFPAEYIVSISKEQWMELKSKFSTSKRGGKNKLPKAFTEKGLYMLATILKSPQATEATICIIEAYAKLRELSSTMHALSKSPPKPEKDNLLSKGAQLVTEIFDDQLNTSGTETSLEVNFAILKFRHTISRRPNRDKD